MLPCAVFQISKPFSSIPVPLQYVPAIHSVQVEVAFAPAVHGLLEWIYYSSWTYALSELSTKLDPRFWVELKTVQKRKMVFKDEWLSDGENWRGLATDYVHSQHLHLVITFEIDPPFGNNLRTRPHTICTTQIHHQGQLSMYQTSTVDKRWNSKRLHHRRKN